MTLASVLGGETHVCPNSLNLDDEDNKTFWETEATRELTKHTPAIKDLSGSDYDIVFFVGGFGAMYDFPNDEHVQRLSREVYEAGGVVAAVCHGPIALVNVKLSDGEYLVKGKNVGGFCNEEEEIIGLLKRHALGFSSSCFPLKLS